MFQAEMKGKAQASSFHKQPTNQPTKQTNKQTNKQTKNAIYKPNVILKKSKAEP